jgi:N-acetylglucosaminyldiphosphoundecaprenol N-acetyl-beta-D-mannosaminyltransferase
MKKPFENVPQKNERSAILGMAVDPTSYEAACQKILRWQAHRESRMVCCANVHMTMLAYDRPDFKALLNTADLVTPDGMPLVWTLRWMGFSQQSRVYGPTLTVKLLSLLAGADVPIGFFGSTPAVLAQLQKRVREMHPSIKIAYAYSPPFHLLETHEKKAIINQINQSGARVIFVGLGCPKQEKWMYENLGKVEAVMLGVGAAFDFIAGTKKQAPAWIQKLGLEWLFRLSQEPYRLWRRYFLANPRFLFLIFREILHVKAGRLRG